MDILHYHFILSLLLYTILQGSACPHFGLQEVVPYLVMDFAPNGTLRQRYPKGTPISPERLVPHVKQVASALMYAHDHRLIHRDIKPENMLLSATDEILLSDFGIALVRSAMMERHRYGEQYKFSLHSAGKIAETLLLSSVSVIE